MFIRIINRLRKTIKPSSEHLYDEELSKTVFILALVIQEHLPLFWLFELASTQQLKDNRTKCRP